MNGLTIKDILISLIKWQNNMKKELADYLNKNRYKNIIKNEAKILIEALETYIEYLEEELRINEDLMLSETIDKIELAEDLIIKIEKKEL